MPPTGVSRVLQVHPTRRCNLCCLHCYSSSGPNQRDELPLGLLTQALEDARAEGYDVAGISGGEPTLYPGLGPLLEHARLLGMRTTVTTHGMFLNKRRLDRLRGCVDVLAISLDGVPDSHDRMRGREGAFRAMSDRLEGVRASGIPFGFIFTLTQHNLDELPWVAGFAQEQGAHLLQIHPLEEAGRAALQLVGHRPDSVEASFAYIVADRIREAAGGLLHVQVDFLNREQLRHHPDQVYADLESPLLSERPLSELVSPLVIEPDGLVVPIQHGFPRRFALGTLRETCLRELSARWRGRMLPAFRSLCRSAFEEFTAASDLPLANWYEFIMRRAADFSAASHSP